MTAIFIHGVPDTALVWRRLRPLLPEREQVALALPGFGCPRPNDFDATKEAYLAWLIAALEAIPAPRDLVAHDWGSILVLRAVTLRPDLVRSWVGGGAPLTADYTWHPTARLWQTHGAGEKAMQRLSPELATAMLARDGLSEEDAQTTARHIDPVMKDSILRLYRSGQTVFDDWAPDIIPGAVPGLVVWGERDAYAAPEFGEQLAASAGASFEQLDCGHWWQLERAAGAASAITSFWRKVGVEV